MKYLILFLSLNLFGVDYTNETELAKGVEMKIYIEDKCPQPCYRIRRKCVLNPVICSLTEFQIDDTTKPLYDKQKAIACSGVTACQEQIQPVCETIVPEGESVGVEICTNYCEEHPNYSPIINELYSETYCASNEAIGYLQKTVERIIIDQVKKEAWNLAIENEKTEAALAKAERVALLIQIRAMIEDVNASDKKPWEKQLLRTLIRELKN